MCHIAYLQRNYTLAGPEHDCDVTEAYDVEILDVSNAH